MSKSETLEDFWAVLGLESGASKADVQRSYRKKSLAVHPDRYKGDNPEWAKEEFLRLTRAKEVLERNFPRTVLPRLGLVAQSGLFYSWAPASPVAEGADSGRDSDGLGGRKQRGNLRATGRDYRSSKGAVAGVQKLGSSERQKRTRRLESQPYAPPSMLVAQDNTRFRTASETELGSPRSTEFMF